MRNGIPEKPHYNLSEFSRIIGVHISTAKRMVSEGALKRVQLRPKGMKVVPQSEAERILRKLGVLK